VLILLLLVPVVLWVEPCWAPVTWRQLQASEGSVVLPQIHRSVVVHSPVPGALLTALLVLRQELALQLPKARRLLGLPDQSHAQRGEGRLRHHWQ
jgi:hypothetical protein